MSLSIQLQNAKLNNDFLKLVDKAQENISFWGYRYIHVLGLEDTVFIDAFAGRVIRLVQEQNFEYTQIEREIGTLISKKIEHLYENNDLRLMNSHFLIRFFCFLRSLPDFSSFLPHRRFITRWNWRHENSFDLLFRDVFQYYTEEQYKDKFGAEPSPYRRCYGFEGQRKDLWTPPKTSYLTLLI